MSGLEGNCPLCGAHYNGWALANPLAQKCGKCGTQLEIKRDGISISAAISPLKDAVATMPSYKVNPQHIKQSV